MGAFPEGQLIPTAANRPAPAYSDALVELKFFLVTLLGIEGVRLDLVVLHLGHDLIDQLG